MSLNNGEQLFAPTQASPVSSGDGFEGFFDRFTERRPRPIALTAAENVAKRNHNRSLPLRRAFAERADNSSQPTPLARLLRGGRGGSVRLRLYLSYLWLGAAPPHELVYPARAWAELLDLDEPETSGARRVADAVRWLEKNNFIEVTNRAGAPNVIRLLSDTGDGKPYETPGSAYNRLKQKKPEAAQIHRYVQFPPTLWTSGWMAVLSPAALAMLIILRVQVGAKDPDTEEVWIAPDYATKTFLLSEETRTRGIRELQYAGLISVRRRQLVATDSFDFRRFRNVYQLNLSALDQPAVVREAVKEGSG
ncbi:hypothetical protein [Micromonospora sp. CA-246542]|uniref:hypothetical protein n=1 Tax=Micromonospora sp. CA-246542 TaxID=3239959 RepID=UPI003D90279F